MYIILSRFAYDGLKRQRLTEPMVRNADNQLKPSNWETSLEIVASKMNEPGARIAAVAGI